jgi:hypothetical protein
MPANNPALRRTKTYGVVCDAGSNTPETCVRAAPKNVQRSMLLIENTGDNDGLVRFGEPVLGDGSDILFTSGSGLLWDRSATCPEASLNFGSADGTTFSVTEQIT